MTDENKQRVFISTCLSSLGGAVGVVVGMFAALLGGALGDHPAFGDVIGCSTASGVAWAVFSFPVSLIVHIICVKAQGRGYNLATMGWAFFLGAGLGTPLLISVWSFAG